MSFERGFLGIPSLNQTFSGRCFLNHHFVFRCLHSINYGATPIIRGIKNFGSDVKKRMKYGVTFADHYEICTARYKKIETFFSHRTVWATFRVSLP